MNIMFDRKFLTLRCERFGSDTQECVEEQGASTDGESDVSSDLCVLHICPTGR